jgi:predicted ATP-dependent serine protease
MAVNLAQVRPTTIPRVSTGINELDWQFGHTGGQWGLPLGKLTVFAGGSGTGKSRTWVEVAKGMNKAGHTILLFQGELPVPQFVSEKLGGYQSETFWVDDTDTTIEQIAAIKQYKPKLVVIDSVNTIKDYNGGYGADIMVNGGTGYGNKWHVGYRKIAEEVGCHIVFLSQANAEGKFKGRTELPHYVDIVMSVKPLWDDFFSVSIPTKNRCGRKGTESAWCHFNWGVECQSENRFDDSNWLGATIVKDHPKQKPASGDGVKAWLKFLFTS